MFQILLIEPPCTERYARWCERSGLFSPSYSIQGRGFRGRLLQNQKNTRNEPVFRVSPGLSKPFRGSFLRGMERGLEGF